MMKTGGRMQKNIVVTYPAQDFEKRIYLEIPSDLGAVHYLADKAKSERAELLRAADVLVALSFSQKEISRKEIAGLNPVGFIQLVFAGADKVPFALIPAKMVLASNVGAFAQPIAEHVLALTLALAKNIVPRYLLLRAGQFDPTGLNRQLSGGICGIVGFGGNGQEIAKIMQAVGLKVYGINRRGKTDVPIEFVGTVADMQKVLEASDVLVVTTPLTRETRNLIGKKELAWMKKNAILINVGRGEVIHQKALYDHLAAHPDFRAGIDTWWSEPGSPGKFSLEYPFFELPNLIGSPHIADHVPGSRPHATRRALENVKNFLMGEKIQGLVDRKDYLD
jgi:phosphoglycerate dehydrogenase-like enzyme